MKRKKHLVWITALLAIVALAAVAFWAFGLPLQVKQITVTFFELRTEELPRFVPEHLQPKDMPSLDPADYVYASFEVELRNPQLYLQHVSRARRADEDRISDEDLWKRSRTSWRYFSFLDYRTIPAFRTGTEPLGQVLIYSDGRTDEQVLGFLRGQEVTIFVDRLLPIRTLHCIQQISLQNAVLIQQPT